MTIELSAQTIITAAGMISGLGVIGGLAAWAIRFIDKQKTQDSDINNLRDAHNADIKAVKEELTVLVYGTLACLKGLSEQGCNGPVTHAIDKLEKHLNQEAHK